MIPVVTNYSGFQSYAQKPYPSLKAGKYALESNTVFEQTAREQDKKNLYNNYNRMNSTYAQLYSQTVKPSDYQNRVIVTKGEQGGKKSDSLDQAVTEQDINIQRGKTGHWQTTYNAGIKDPYQIQRAVRPEWTLPKQAYCVKQNYQQSDYKANYGELGTKPSDKLLKEGELPSDDLKMGTTKSSYQIPGYSGFMANAHTLSNAYDQSKGKQLRTTYLKQNIIENYKTQIPGYAGHIPQNQANQKANLRTSCFNSHEQ